jgi:hypothetical protein
MPVGPWKKSSRFMLLAAIILGGCTLVVCTPKIAYAENALMTLSVTSFEANISYRDVQWRAPIGMITNPCSQADFFVASIDWGDGTGEHKPETNVRQRQFSRENQILVVENGVYLFWDDTHAFARSGTYIARAKVTFHCLGDPPGNRDVVNEIAVNAYARIPVNQVEFSKSEKKVNEVAGHQSVDLTITLDAPAPASGTWVRLEARPEGTFNSLPPYYRVSPQQTQETIRNLEVRKPAAMTTLTVIARTVGRSQETDKLSITP